MNGAEVDCRIGRLQKMRGKLAPVSERQFGGGGRSADQGAGGSPPKQMKKYGESSLISHCPTQVLASVTRALHGFPRPARS